MSYHTFSITGLIKTVLAKLATEPAAVIGLLASVGDLFAKGWTPEAAIPAAAGLIIRFFVTPTAKVVVTATPITPANAPAAPTDQAGAVSAVELCVIVLTGLVILLLLGVVR